MFFSQESPLIEVVGLEEHKFSEYWS